MTTLKEYKEMMEGATDAPWSIDTSRGTNRIIGGDGSTITDDEQYYPSAPYERDLPFISASRNLAPELIRVIELAESALEVSLSMSENECWPVEEIVIKQALSEIRKLKGEEK